MQKEFKVKTKLMPGPKSEMFDKNQEKLFEYFLNFLSFNKRQYLIYKFCAENSKLFDSYPPSFITLSSTLLRGHLLGLAILLDPQTTKKGEENFSARLFDVRGRLEQLDVKIITNKVFRLRSKWIAHQDLDFVFNQNKIEEIDLKKEIDEIKLFDIFVEIARDFANLKLPNHRCYDGLEKRFSETEEKTNSFLSKFNGVDLIK